MYCAVCVFVILQVIHTFVRLHPSDLMRIDRYIVRYICIYKDGYTEGKGDNERKRREKKESECMCNKEEE